MPCQGSLRRPLRHTLKSIGFSTLPFYNTISSLVWHGQSIQDDHATVLHSITGQSHLQYTTHTTIRDRYNHSTCPRMTRLLGKCPRCLPSPGRARPHVFNGSRHMRTRSAATTKTFWRSTSTIAPDHQDSTQASEHGARQSENAEKIKTGALSVVESRHDQQHSNGRVRSVLSSYRGNAGESFNSVIANAEQRPRDGKAGKFVARLKEGEDFNLLYFHRYRHRTASALGKRHRAWQIQKERHSYPTTDDWRRILLKLENSTPVGPELYKRRQETVRLPDGIYAVFVMSANLAILEIMQRTGCHIQVVQEVRQSVGVIPEDQSPFSSVSLYGSTTENAAALKILPDFIRIRSAKGSDVSADLNDFAIQHEVRQTFGASPQNSKMDLLGPDGEGLTESDIEILENELDGITGSSSKKETELPVRAIWTTDRQRLRTDTKRLQNQPIVKTAVALSAYIDELTEPVPRLVRRQSALPKSVDSATVQHEDSLNKLISLFEDPDIVKAIPSSAVSRAIQHCATRSNLAAFRKIYKSLEDGGYVFTTSNYNALLAAAARAGDVHNFNHTLGVMVRRGLVSSPQTWAIFHDLMCRRFPLESSVVLEAMRNKGLLLDYITAHQVAANAVANDLAAHLALRGDLEAFFRLYDNRFGVSYGLSNFNWLSPVVAHHMIKTLLATGRVRDAFGVLEEMWVRNEHATIETSMLNVFLTSSLRADDPSSAVFYLKHFRVGEKGALVPDRVTYYVLFVMAWRSRYFNMVRVIWRYACAAGHVAHMMKYRIWMSLINYEPEQLDKGELVSRGRLFKLWAGKFAAGVAEGLPCGQRDADHAESNAGAADKIFRGQLETSPEHSATAEPSEHDKLTIHLSSQPVHARTSAEHRDRFKALQSMLENDLDQTGRCRPTRSLTEILENAWQRDVQWQEKGFTSPESIKDAAAAHECFQEMMSTGVQVPVIPGDFSLENRPWEVPSRKRRR